MVWNKITNNTDWEYDDNPSDPGIGNAQRGLWLKQTNGIRTNPDGTKIYTKCRRVGSSVETQGEINKTFHDNV